MNLGSQYTKTTDRSVRKTLIDSLKKQTPSNVVFEEFDIVQGRARADVVTINSGKMHGYEIKSDSDSLARLPQQVKYYNQVFSTVTLVVGKGYIGKAIYIIPDWWGIIVANGAANGVILNTIREAKENQKISIDAAADLLKKHEIVDILCANSPGIAYCNMTKTKLMNEMKNLLPSDKLIGYLPEVITYRQNKLSLR